jgi:ABC-type antimicrobial peptide transport system permease subunit
VLSLLFSCVLGVLAGLYPALRAARMAPMEAIRRG